MKLDDPHDLAVRYGRAADQQHGTAMAGIILNGDGHAPTPVPHRLYVQPVTVPAAGYERFPDDRLAVYVLYEALNRMLVGVIGDDGAEIAPVAAPHESEVPYAIAVTLEVGVDSEIDVFTEVDVGIRTRVPIRVRAGSSS